MPFRLRYLSIALSSDLDGGQGRFHEGQVI